MKKVDLSWPEWRKSSHSSEQGDACVELAVISRLVAVRDSRDPDGPKFVMSRRDFPHFIETLKRL